MTRESDGQISLTFRTTTGVVKYTAPINIWASHFCDASAGGEGHFRFFTALKFLKSEGPIDVVPVSPEQEGVPPHGTGEWIPPKPKPASREGICDLCGEPMPAGEEMFRFHGLSGPCPVKKKG